MKFATHRNIILILVILHIVGLVGISIPQTRDLVLSLSPINLFIGFLLLLVSEFNNKRSLLTFILFAFVIGFGSELIGVHTGILFGNYSYGANLGLKFMEVPLIIGINWAVLAITSASLTEKLTEYLSVKVLVNTVLMVFFDFIMEPVAMKSDFWSWHNDEIPFYNYVCWFFIALLLQVIYLIFFKIKSNIVFKSLFIIQLVFFILLNLF
jgi:putative membrane protein